MAVEVDRGGERAGPWRLRLSAVQVFSVALAVQVVHQVEHSAQLLQYAVLRIRPAQGLFGSVFDLEWVHVVYNGGLYLALLLATAALVLERRARPPLGWLLLGGALAIQTYHAVEHSVKIVQYVTKGVNPAPGILGQIFDLVWLHFIINAIVLVLMAAAFLGLGLHRELGASVRAGMVKLRQPRTIGALATVAVVAAGVAAIPRLAAGASPAALPPARFVEEASAAGISQVYDGFFEFFVGGGVAAFDCSEDGKPDLYFAGGSNAAALYRNESPVGGALRFMKLPDPATDLTGVTGAYPIDVDGDGRMDLVVLRRGENVLLRGLGGCRFERANEAWAFDGGTAWTTAFSAKWEASASLPTLAFGNYVDEASNDSSDLCLDNVLLRPAAAGPGFGSPIPLTPSWCTLSMLFSDWDRSGRMDLRVANDRQYYSIYGNGEEQLWRVASGQPPRLYARDDGWTRLNIWGMGIASYDVTGDGYPEYFLTSMGDSKLQTLAAAPAQPRYRDIAVDRGVAATRPFTGDTTRPSTAWHAEFRDVNNDGYVDLFIAKGNVEAMPESAARDPSNLLLGQPDGTFQESADAAGIVSFSRARGAALADFNLDGMVDLVVVNRRENVKLWRSVGWGTAAQPTAMGGWIALRLLQPGPNRDAIGSWIEVKVGNRTMRRELTIGGGQAGGQLGWINFGLGDATTADVRVQWPGGETGPWLTVSANEFAVIDRGASAPRLWLPAP